MIRPIIIFDDTIKHQSGSGEEYLNLFPEDKDLVIVCTDLERYITHDTSSSDEVVINTQLLEFEFVFFHNSYDDPVFDPGQISSFKSQIPNLFTFSGGSFSDIQKGVLSRLDLYQNLNRVVKAYRLTGIFSFQSLFDNNLSPYDLILQKMEGLLEEGKTQLLSSAELKIVLKAIGLNPQEITHYISILADKPDQEINEILFDLRYKLN